MTSGTKAYNQLPLLEQRATSRLDNHLAALGEIFVKHGVHGDFALAVPHRHCALDEGQVMVHETFDDSIVECRPRQMNEQLVPYSYHVLHGHIYPYEFHRGSFALGLPHAFVQETCHAARQWGLDGYIGICRKGSLPPGAMQIESELLGMQGTRTEVLPRDEWEQRFDGCRFQITAWYFVEEKDGEVTVNCLKGCRADAFGKHDVTAPRD
ncbi:hypothetical protein ANO11243_067850 [Dothideomycetidae sp. 11243]|nr:hypothetical protein ANO11243_067850 [fungal sp. No.11243]